MKPVSKELIEKAISLYCEENPTCICRITEEGHFALMDDGQPSDRDVEIWEEDGKLKCSNPESGMIFAEYLKDLQDPPKKTEQAIAQAKHRNGQSNAIINPPGRTSGQEGNAISRWRQPRSYDVAGGKEVPNAFAVSEEANLRGLQSQIISSGRDKARAWAQVRVIDPATGQFREDAVSFDRETFFCLKSWEYAGSQAKYQRDLIVGVDDSGEFLKLPRLNPEATIKGKPASLWLALEVLRAWSFADRDAITKAERRAQLKILNREWREDAQEIDLEDAEAKAVAGP